MLLVSLYYQVILDMSRDLLGVVGDFSPTTISSIV